MNTQEHDKGPTRHATRAGQWTSTVEDNLDYFDALCWTLALSICTETERGGHQHFSEGLGVDYKSCDDCYEVASKAVTVDLNHMLSAAAKEAFSCGREGIPEREAERRSLWAAVQQSARLAFSENEARSLLIRVGQRPYNEYDI